MLVFGITGMLFLSSCLKTVSYPVEPMISNPRYVTYPDSCVVTFAFTDGDGDIGFRESDKNEVPFNNDSSFYFYNLYLSYYEYQNGQWVLGKAGVVGNPPYSKDSINFPFQIDNITPQGKNKAIKGDISVTINPVYFNPISPSNDSIMYKIILIDRALHISNILETGLILH